MNMYRNTARPQTFPLLYVIYLTGHCRAHATKRIDWACLAMIVAASTFFCRNRRLRHLSAVLNAHCIHLTPQFRGCALQLHRQLGGGRGGSRHWAAPQGGVQGLHALLQH